MKRSVPRSAPQPGGEPPVRLVLASASPRRQQLLKAAGFHFAVVPAAVTEVQPPYLTAAETTLFNARRKALAVAARHPASVVLAADTLVAIDGHILGKPAHLDAARAMLRRLSGRTHAVFTGVCILHTQRRAEHSVLAASRVTFRRLSPADIEGYLTLVDPLDKAGAYAAQDDPLHLIARITGSRTNVIGLPMELVEPLLRRCGV